MSERQDEELGACAGALQAFWLAALLFWGPLIAVLLYVGPWL